MRKLFCIFYTLKLNVKHEQKYAPPPLSFRLDNYTYIRVIYTDLDFLNAYTHVPMSGYSHNCVRASPCKYERPPHFYFFYELSRKSEVVAAYLADRSFLHWSLESFIKTSGKPISIVTASDAHIITLSRLSVGFPLWGFL